MGAISLNLVYRGQIGIAIVLALAFQGSAGLLFGQSDQSNGKHEGVMPFNLKLKTRGGRQFWTDIVYLSDWRVQRNAVTGHHRLIDPKDVRQGWGTLEQCKLQLDGLVASGDIRPNAGKLVIILHGLMRSSHSMAPLADYLEENSDYQAINIEYASSRGVIARHANDLARLIRHLGPDVTEINFVAHSMGNIVIRHYLSDLMLQKEGMDPRFHRMVMLGPPNHGSQFAHFLRNNPLFNAAAGVAGKQLGEKWEDLEPHLATPPFEFGIISGAQDETQKLNNFVLTGPDDFTVSLEETRLMGAKDWLVRPLLHSTMMKNKITLESTLRFIEEGYFISAKEMNPIEAQPESKTE